MLKVKSSVNSVNNFDLKNQNVDLIGKNTLSHIDINLKQLENMRISKIALSASKNALETICGASCETGAQ